MKLPVLISIGVLIGAAGGVPCVYADPVSSWGEPEVSNLDEAGAAKSAPTSPATDFRLSDLYSLASKYVSLVPGSLQVSPAAAPGAVQYSLPIHGKKLGSTVSSPVTDRLSVFARVGGMKWQADLNKENASREKSSVPKGPGPLSIGVMYEF